MLRCAIFYIIRAGEIMKKKVQHLILKKCKFYQMNCLVNIFTDFPTKPAVKKKKVYKIFLNTI